MKLARLVFSAAFALGCVAPAFGAAFSVSSPAFPDGGSLPASGAQTSCGGTQVSPPLAFSNAPEGTKSFAILLYDPDTKGPGFSHWVAYGIPGSTRSIAAGYGAETAGHVGGANGAGGSVFLGYCPGVGDVAHHYVFAVYATDLAPDALAPGLNRDQLLAALKGHVVAATSIVGRFGR